MITFGRTRITIKKGDITAEDTEAIVNAANTSLMGGGGVDGAIHRKGGPAILEDCRKIVARQGRCKTGEAVITTAGSLRAKHVIHTVGPVWKDGSRGEDELLRAAYRNSLRLALENGVKSIAFPSISTGAYGYPIDKAARIAIAATREHCEVSASPDEVRFVLYAEADLRVYRNLLEEMGLTAKS